MPRPRSKLVEAIAVLLLSRPMRAAEIAQILGYPVNYVSSYLSYWKVRGLFTYENGFWKLTEEGERFAKNVVAREMDTRVDKYAALAKAILGERKVKHTTNNKTGSYPYPPSSGLQQFTAALTEQTSNKQQDLLLACIDSLLNDVELEDDEREVFEYLLDHYAKWGMTYTYIEGLEEALNADRNWLLRILRALQSKGLVYIYMDKRLGVRIGLSKKVKAYLNACARE